MNATLTLRDIWVGVQHRQGIIEDATFGLMGEAQRLIQEAGGEGTITAVALGLGLEAVLESLGAYGADRVIYAESDSLSRYQGELHAEVLRRLVKKHRPSCFLMAQSSETMDLSARLAALLETAVITQAVDLKIDEDGQGVAIRPVANGYLFEKRLFNTSNFPIICFLPSVLSESEPDVTQKAEMVLEPVEISSYDLKTKVVGVIEADPKELGIEEADIVVAGGRGVGKGDAFDIIHELARLLGGSVGGTRPVIDWQTLPFERQIGQTGKTVGPRLLFVCGISGANEFTAGMEKSRIVIALNTDPGARIFRFADLGVIGDVHELIPRLIQGLKQIENSVSEDIPYGIC